jgi:hypothetical protein
VLESHRLTRADAPGEHHLYATGPVERFRAIARSILGEDLEEVIGVNLG